MMNFKLILQNLKRNIKDYVIYFITLALAVAIFYAFNAVTGAKALESMNDIMQTMLGAFGSTIELLSAGIAVLLGFLILYVNQYLLKRRKKELGIYMLLGMKKRAILMIFVGETFCMGILSFLAGIVFGAFLNQILVTVALRIFGGNVADFQLSFSVHAFWYTLMCYGIIFFLSSIFHVWNISGEKLLDLLTAERKNEELKQRNQILYFLFFAISLVCLIAGVLGLRTEEVIPDKRQWIVSGSMITFGTLLFFYSVSAVVLWLTAKNRSFYYKDVNSFLVCQIGSKIQSNFMTMTAVCLLLTCTIVFLTTGISIASTMAKNTQSSAPYDVTIYYIGDDKETETDIFTLMTEAHPEIDLSEMIEESIIYAERVTSDMCYGDIIGKDTVLWDYDEARHLKEQNVKVIGINTANRIRRLCGEPELTLGDNEFYLNCTYAGTKEYCEVFLKNKGKVTLDGVTLYAAQNKLLTDTYSMSNVGLGDYGTLIISDKLAESGQVQNMVLNGNWRAEVDPEEASLMLSNLQYEKSEAFPFGWMTKSFWQTTYYSAMGMPVFLCTYIGSIFLLICVALLAVQQLIEISDNQKRYRILDKQGVSLKMRKRVLLKQIGVYFFTPLILAVLYAAFALPVIIGKISTFYHMEIGSNMIVPLILLCVIYILYYFATFNSGKNILFYGEYRD